jgi:hypothetical protein
MRIGDGVYAKTVVHNALNRELTNHIMCGPQYKSSSNAGGFLSLRRYEAYDWPEEVIHAKRTETWDVRSDEQICEVAAPLVPIISKCPGSELSLLQREYPEPRTQRDCIVSYHPSSGG